MHLSSSKEKNRLKMFQRETKKKFKLFSIINNYLSKLSTNIGLLLIGGGDEMVVVYATLIVKGVKTIQQVPTKLQADVRNHLNSLDLDENGNPLSPIATSAA